MLIFFMHGTYFTLKGYLNLGDLLDHGLLGFYLISFYHLVEPHQRLLVAPQGLGVLPVSHVGVALFLQLEAFLLSWFHPAGTHSILSSGIRHGCHPGGSICAEVGATEAVGDALVLV